MMKTRKLLGIVLSILIAVSMTTVSAASVSANGEGEVFTTLGVIGTLSGGWDADVDMTDYDGDGIYEVTIEGVAAGNYEFKVRADDAWDITWSVFDPEQNDGAGATISPGGDNVKVSFDADTDVTITLDTNGEDYEQWPISYSYFDANGETQIVYTGNPDTRPEPKPEPQPEPIGSEVFSSLGVIGTLTGGWDSDVDMTDEDGDGIYEVTIPNVKSGDYQFKVRADHKWDMSWTYYNEEIDSTFDYGYGSIHLTLPANSDVVVFFDTSLEDELFEQWAVSYSYSDENGVLQTVYTGNPVYNPERVRITSRNDYIYFDNSQTQWDTVCAYWWNNNYERTYDMENNDYGWSLSDDGYGKPIGYPGTQMTRIEDTNIWQVKIPFHADYIIFNSGVSDLLVREGFIAYNTSDLHFDEADNAGMIYVINTSVPAKSGALKFKTKYTYSEGEWKTYTGSYQREAISLPLQNTSTVSSTNIVLGKSFTIKAASIGGSGTVKYAVWYKKTTDTKWTQVQNYSTNTSVKISPLSVSPYEISVKAKDEKGTVSKQTFKITVLAHPDPLTNTSKISANKITKGNSVTVTASSTGGIGIVKYAVWYRKAGSSKWTQAQDYGTNASIRFIPKYTGIYEVSVKAKDEDKTVVKKLFKVTVVVPLTNTSTISADSISKGKSVTVTVSSTGGSGTVKYGVWYRKTGASTWTKAQDYSTNTKVSFTPKHAGTYEISVKAKDGKSTVAKKVLKVTVIAPLVNTSKLSSSTVSIGKAITITASSTGGKGTVKYAVWYKKATSSDWTQLQKYSTNTTIKITPRSASTYYISVKAKDENGTVVKKSLSIKPTAS